MNGEVQMNQNYSAARPAAGHALLEMLSDVEMAGPHLGGELRHSAGV
jgi:hypothetical protein